MEENPKRKKEGIFLLRFLFQILFFEERKFKAERSSSRFRNTERGVGGTIPINLVVNQHSYP
jgi:hypothetical protein